MKELKKENDKLLGQREDLLFGKQLDEKNVDALINIKNEYEKQISSLKQQLNSPKSLQSDQ